jgi:hypothetical protein
MSMPNRQKQYINTETPKGNCTAKTQQYGTTKYAETYQLPRVQLITPDDGQRRLSKHVEFRNKIKFWKLDASCWLFIRR